MTEPDHSPEFHAALERIGTIAQLFDQGVAVDQIVNTATKHSMTEREAMLAFNLLQEACGAVFADQLGISVVSFVIRDGGKDTTHQVNENQDYQAAYFLAHNLRHGGRNDLFAKIGQTSSVLNTINNAMNSDPNMKLEDLKGAQLSFLVCL